MPEEQNKKYTLKKADTGVVGDHVRNGAEVDDIQLWPGGKPVELTDDQVKRLKDAGATVEEYKESDETPDENPNPPAPFGQR